MDRERNEEEELPDPRGKWRHYAQRRHARGGVLIAPGKLTDFCPPTAGRRCAAMVSQYDKDDVGGRRSGQVRLPRPHPR